ncbi:hypothetical protein PQO03_02840 [Lentisphaera profundi]|uniref:VanZ-like domain-containing protein n=1 Tax=Lentisphaera profundi TaxID=1658616 RepID=A0ABY7VUL5_9BACT|nr:hypothetical protein [Lentisphaera profundi]WDE96895.1 hypothetical protein PQO03_02840 [Lentisphaera profundi]
MNKKITLIFSVVILNQLWQIYERWSLDIPSLEYINHYITSIEKHPNNPLVDFYEPIEYPIKWVVVIIALTVILCLNKPKIFIKIFFVYITVMSLKIMFDIAIEKHIKNTLEPNGIMNSGRYLISVIGHIMLPLLIIIRNKKQS